MTTYISGPDGAPVMSEAALDSISSLLVSKDVGVAESLALMVLTLKTQPGFVGASDDDIIDFIRTLTKNLLGELLPALN